ncbi:hypothetical protein [Spongorhabdus nitratireducens]
MSNNSLRVVVSIVMVATAIITTSLQEYRDNKDIRADIEVALDDLSGKDLNPAPGEQSLEILPAGRYVSDAEIESLLQRSYGKSQAYIYSYRGVGPYTMSAQGTDQSHYLVNTFLEGYQPFAVENVMMPLYVLSQRKSYVLDEEQYDGRPEVWQTSRQAFLYPRGDCEDHAIALADWLIEMGHDARVAIGDVDGNGHAWVILFRDGKEYLLEATQKSGLGRNKPYPVASLYIDYHPQYMFNREHFWVNKGSKLTTRYSGEKWKKVSRYIAGSN